MAVFPPTFSVGGIRSGAPTLYHAVALEMLGIDPFGGDIDAANAWCAAFVLSKSPSEVRNFMSSGMPDMDKVKEWVDKCGVGVSEIVSAVRSALRSASVTYVPGKSKNAGQVVPSGFGWPLEMAESLCHEYRMTFDEAMSMPTCRAFALMACCRARNSGEAGGPDYYGRLFLKQLKELKAQRKEVEDGGE